MERRETAVTLYEHNRPAYESISEMLQHGNIVMLESCPGSGKLARGFFHFMKACHDALRHCPQILLRDVLNPPADAVRRLRAVRKQIFR